MAEIIYRHEYDRHQLYIDSLAPSEAIGELSLSVTARSDWGGDHVMTKSFVLLTEEDVISLRDCLDQCIADIKERKIKDRSLGKPVQEKPVTQTKKFRPRKRRTNTNEGR